MARTTKRPTSGESVYYATPISGERTGQVVDVLSTQFTVLRDDGMIDFVFFTDNWRVIDD